MFRTQIGWYDGQGRRLLIAVLLFLAGMFLLTSTGMPASLIVVDRYGSGDFPTIQEGIDAAVDGDTVLVRAGSYRGTGNRNLDFGGRAIHLVSESGPEATVIDCQGVDRGFIFQNGEGLGSVLSGFTVRNGRGSGEWPLANGGAILFQFGTSPLITNNIFEDCQGYYGGALECNYANPVLQFNIIRNNIAEQAGGGVHSFFGSPQLKHNLIHGNQATTNGGGVMFYNSENAILRNNTIVMNSAPWNGGGVGFYSNCGGTFTDCIVWGNSAGLEGDALYAAPTATLTLSHTDLEGGASGVGGGGILIWGPGNLDAAPLLVTGLQGGFYLGQTAAGQPADSPCLDAGSAMVDSFELAGRTTRTDQLEDAGQVDLGAHLPILASPRICVDQAALSFQAVLGDPAPAAQLLEIRNCGLGALSWSASDDAAWLTGSPEAGISGGEPQGIQLTVNPGGMPRGSYSAWLTFFAPGAVNSPLEVNVLLQLSRLWRVDAAGGGDFLTIQEGIDAALEGDIVEVAAGIYSGPGNSDLDLGGKALTIRSAAGPEVTIIDCQAAGRAFHFHSGEGPQSLVSGLTLRNGLVSGSWPLGNGGGILCTDGSSPTIEDCLIEECTADYGGAIHCNASSPLIRGCRLAGNTAVQSGGAIQAHDASPVLINNLLAGNAAGANGGAILVYGPGSTLTVSNCTFAGNAASLEGGAFSLLSSAAAAVSNSILWGDSAAGAGGELFADSGSPVYLEHTDLQGGPLGAGGSGSFTWGAGMIDADPLFATDGAGRGFFLSQTATGHPADSPCLDAGSSTPEASGLTARTTRIDRTPDTDQTDLGFHYPADSASPPVIAVGLTCLPASGTVPFTASFSLQLANPSAQYRRLAGRVDLRTGSGQSFSNWRSGSTNLNPGEVFSTSWNQAIPAMSLIIGQNVFTLTGIDVTPSPFNEPPYLPSGSSDTATCTVAAHTP